jgi:hypothetical protein
VRDASNAFLGGETTRFAVFSRVEHMVFPYWLDQFCGATALQDTENSFVNGVSRFQVWLISGVESKLFVNPVEEFRQAS